MTSQAQTVNGRGLRNKARYLSSLETFLPSYLSIFSAELTLLDSFFLFYFKMSQGHEKRGFYYFLYTLWI
jgi:hypothetical protein